MTASEWFYLHESNFKTIRLSQSAHTYFFSIRHFAQCAFCAARMCDSAVAHNLRLFCILIGTTLCALILAQRAR